MPALLRGKGVWPRKKSAASQASSRKPGIGCRPRFERRFKQESQSHMISQSFRSNARRWWRTEIRPLVIITMVVFSIRSSLADWNDVPSGSMKPTILEGDRVFVNKLAYDLKVPFTTWHLFAWANPQRGDIVVFYSPYDGKRLVKRVIGLPGDVLELQNDHIILNGQAVQYTPFQGASLDDLSSAERASHTFVTEQLPHRPHAMAAWPAVRARRDFAPFNIPAGEYFMMGDNRDNSFDSRYYGPVDRNRILGHATMAVLSFDRAHYWLPRWHRFFTAL
jgi:signal peptidase I